MTYNRYAKLTCAEAVAYWQRALAALPRRKRSGQPAPLRAHDAPWFVARDGSSSASARLTQLVADLEARVPILGHYGLTYERNGAPVFAVNPPLDPRNVSVALAFYEVTVPTLTEGTTSYGLKHRVERWLHGEVGHGAVIASLLLLRLPLYRDFASVVMERTVDAEAHGCGLQLPEIEDLAWLAE